MSVRHIMNLFYVWYSYKATPKLPWYHWILIRNIIVPYLSQNFLHFPPQGPDCNNDHYGTKCELELPSNNIHPECHVQTSKPNTFKRKKCPRDVASNYQRSTASDIGAALTQFTGWSVYCRWSRPILDNWVIGLLVTSMNGMHTWRGLSEAVNGDSVLMSIWSVVVGILRFCGIALAKRRVVNQWGTIYKLILKQRLLSWLLIVLLVSATMSALRLSSAQHQKLNFLGLKNNSIMETRKR